MRKGELNSMAIDRSWPFQVSLPADECTGDAFLKIQEFCRPLSAAPRWHSYIAGDRYHSVFCFAEKAHAEMFAAAFDGKNA